jgi:hypothetical protein
MMYHFVNNMSIACETAKFIPFRIRAFSMVQRQRRLHIRSKQTDCEQKGMRSNIKIRKLYTTTDTEIYCKHHTIIESVSTKDFIVHL